MKNKNDELMFADNFACWDISLLPLIGTGRGEQEKYRIVQDRLEKAIFIAFSSLRER